MLFARACGTGHHVEPNELRSDHGFALRRAQLREAVVPLRGLVDHRAVRPKPGELRKGGQVPTNAPDHNIVALEVCLRQEAGLGEAEAVRKLNLRIVANARPRIGRVLVAPIPLAELVVATEHHAKAVHSLPCERVANERNASNTLRSQFRARFALIPRP